MPKTLLATRDRRVARARVKLTKRLRGLRRRSCKVVVAEDRDHPQEAIPTLHLRVVSRLYLESRVGVDKTCDCTYKPLWVAGS